MKPAPEILRRPVEIPDELTKHQNYYHDVADRRRASINTWWRKRVSQISDEWQHTDISCACSGSEAHPHNKIRFRKDGRNYICCPVSYWLALKRYNDDYNNTNMLYILLGDAVCQTQKD